MDIFARLERLILSQDSSHTSSASLLASLGVPSTSVAVLIDGSISSRCFSTIGDDEDTVFQACSISKPAAGLAVMRLIDQGKLGLDDQIGQLLPSEIMQQLTPPTSPKLLPLVEGITIKQLLSHTAGLSVHGFPGYSTREGSGVPTARQVLTGKSPVNTLPVCLQGLPGQAFSYSGGGITVLQLILERITQKDFPSLMQELVLSPLGMTQSFYHTSPGQPKLGRTHWTGYVQTDEAYRVNPEQAAAGLWTTPGDLLKLVQAVQKSLESPDDSGFLRQHTARQMLTEVDGDMALSWFARRDPGIAFSHAGNNFPGFSCFVVGFADILGVKRDDIPRDAGIAVMTNSIIGNDVIWKVIHAVSYLQGWLEVPRSYGSGEGVVPFILPDTEAGRGWEAWIGSWRDGRSVLRIATAEDGRPVVRYAELPPANLLPAAMPPVKHSRDDHYSAWRVEGLSMMLRLGFADKIKVVELWNGFKFQVTILKEEART